MQLQCLINTVELCFAQIVSFAWMSWRLMERVRSNTINNAAAERLQRRVLCCMDLLQQAAKTITPCRENFVLSNIKKNQSIIK